MKRTLLCTLMLVLAHAAIADTLTKRPSGAEVNGTVTYDGHIFQVAAKYDGVEQMLHIFPEDIEKIVLNDLLSNSKPPTTLDSFPNGPGSTGTPKGCKVTLILLNGSQRRATLVKVTATDIFLKGSVLLKRSAVSTIVID